MALSAANLPLVMSAHGLAPGPEHAVCSAADQLIAHCFSQVGDLARFGIGRDRITVIPPGADTAFFRPASLAIRGGPLQRILVVGLSNQDGLASLVRSLSQLPEAELVIAGGMPEALTERLHSLARDLWVGNRVLMLGDVPWERMPALYRSADVLVSLRIGGGFSPVIQEAMACGVPIAGYRGEETARSVVDGSTGVLVEPGDIYGLTKALSALLGDQLLRMHFASAARRRAEEQFTWSRTAHRVTEVYTQAIRRTQFSKVP
jgi:glycosyltransferase involved in cell wall biosynthesis